MDRRVLATEAYLGLLATLLSGAYPMVIEELKPGDIFMLYGDKPICVMINRDQFVVWNKPYYVHNVSPDFSNLRIYQIDKEAICP